MIIPRPGATCSGPMWTGSSFIDFTTSLLPSGNTLSLAVKQKAYQWGVTNLTDADQFDYTFEPLEQKTITLAVKSSGEWNISNIPDWITVSIILEVAEPRCEGDCCGTQVIACA